jgi:hypothetical protein
LSLSPKDLDDNRKTSQKIIDDARKFRKRQVRLAISTNTTVPYSLAQLIEDGHGVDTIRKVYRNESP